MPPACGVLKDQNVYQDMAGPGVVSWLDVLIAVSCNLGCNPYAHSKVCSRLHKHLNCGDRRP
jgi:hypothetical protein